METTKKEVKIISTPPQLKNIEVTLDVQSFPIAVNILLPNGILITNLDDFIRNPIYEEESLRASNEMA